MIGARVAVDAHLFGAMGGLGMALVEKGFHRRIFDKNPEPRKRGWFGKAVTGNENSVRIQWSKPAFIEECGLRFLDGCFTNSFYIG